MPHLPLPSLLTRARFFSLLFALLAWFGAPRAAVAYVLNSQEAALADLLVNDPGQMRGPMQLDPILAQVARARAQDMATRNYFAHVNPDGLAANALVRAAGYELPAYWGTVPTDNFIESIAAGRTLASDTWADLMASPPHRTHLLATDTFYQNQTSYGVGYAAGLVGDTYQTYWVVITAPPNTATTSTPPIPGNAALFVAQTVPTTMASGVGYLVNISFQNTGSNTWTQGAGYQLISQSPQDNTEWGLSRVNLPTSVAPGQTVNFVFILTAPAMGSYPFQWQMYQEGSGAFGDATPLLTMPVTAAPPPPPPRPAVSASANYWKNLIAKMLAAKKKKKKK